MLGLLVVEARLSGFGGQKGRGRVELTLGFDLRRDYIKTGKGFNLEWVCKVWARVVELDCGRFNLCFGFYLFCLSF